MINIIIIIIDLKQFKILDISILIGLFKSILSHKTNIYLIYNVQLACQKFVTEN